MILKIRKIYRNMKMYRNVTKKSENENQNYKKIKPLPLILSLSWTFDILNNKLCYIK